MDGMFLEAPAPPSRQRGFLKGYLSCAELRTRQAHGHRWSDQQRRCARGSLVGSAPSRTSRRPHVRRTRLDRIRGSRSTSRVRTDVAAPPVGTVGDHAGTVTAGQPIRLRHAEVDADRAIRHRDGVPAPRRGLLDQRERGQRQGDRTVACFLVLPSFGWTSRSGLIGRGAVRSGGSCCAFPQQAPHVGNPKVKKRRDHVHDERPGRGRHGTAAPG
jgi:hypothetical protein